MKLPLDATTISRAFDLARELLARGDESESNFIVAEVLAALADSKWLNTVIENWFIGLPPRAGRRPSGLFESVSPITSDLTTLGYRAHAIRLITSALDLFPRPPGQEIQRIVTGREAGRTSSGIIDPKMLAQEAAEVARTNKALGIALFGSACRLASAEHTPLSDLVKYMDVLPKQSPVRLSDEEIQTIGRSAYDLHWSGRPEPAVRLGLTVPAASANPEALRRVWEDLASEAKKPPVQKPGEIIEVGLKMHKAGYALEGANLVLDSLDLGQDEPSWSRLWPVVDREMVRANVRPTRQAGFVTRSLWGSLTGLQPKISVPTLAVGTGATAGTAATMPQAGSKAPAEVPPHPKEPGPPSAPPQPGIGEPSPHRYLNVFFTTKEENAQILQPVDPLFATQSYYLLVEVNPVRRGLGEESETFPDGVLDKVWEKNQSVLPILIVVSSKDFTVSPQTQPLNLPREGASTPVSFSVVPNIGNGWARLQVEAFYRGNLLQSKQVETYVLPAADSRRPPGVEKLETAHTTFTITTQLNPMFLGQLPERVLTIAVERDIHSGTFDFRFLDRTQGDCEVAFYHTRVEAENLTPLIEAVRAQMEQAARAYAFNLDGTDNLFNQWLPLLAHVGRNLYRTLLPGVDVACDDQSERLKALLKPDTVIQVTPVVGKSTLPWACMYERMVRYIPGKTKVCDRVADFNSECEGCPNIADSERVCPHAFWGYRYSVEQLPYWTDEETSERTELVRTITNARPLKLSLNVWNRFTLWQKHLEKLKEWLKTDPLLAENLGTMQKIWAQNDDLDLVYFYCHGGTDAILLEPYLELSDAKIYSNVIESYGLKWRHRPLVFLNACDTANYRPDSYISLIDDFRRGGASGIVGTECPVPEYFAEDFAKALLKPFFLGSLLGKAMLDVRRDYLRRKNPLGMIYTLYAANEIALNSAVPRWEGQ